MKIRIRGNSIRFRLSKSEVELFGNKGYLEEHTSFGNNAFTYAVQSQPSAEGLSAAFENGKITLSVPAVFVKDWPENQVVGMEGRVPAGAEESLFLLLEKDFKCIDHTFEDQTDNYENPHQTC